MWHRVTALLGGMTVAECQRRMTETEFTRWCALWNLDPWGPERDDLRVGILSAMVANLGKKNDRVRPRDFVLSRFDAARRKTNDWRIQKARAMHYFLAINDQNRRLT